MSNAIDNILTDGGKALTHYGKGRGVYQTPSLDYDKTVQALYEAVRGNVLGALAGLPTNATSEQVQKAVLTNLRELFGASEKPPSGNKLGGKQVAKLSAEIEKTFKSWNFQSHTRHCFVNPLKYGVSEGSYVIEEWPNDQVAKLIADDLVTDLQPSDLDTKSRPSKAQEAAGISKEGEDHE